MSKELMDDDIRYLRKWLNEENTSPIDRKALATVLHEVVDLRDRMGGSEGLHRINSNKIKFLKDQLAAAQAQIKVMREALEMMMLPMPHKDETPLSICKAISARAQEALAQPTDDSALREMLKQERDALRYRWLRENKFKYNGHCQMLNGPILWEENLDAAIDKAMEQTK